MPRKVVFILFALSMAILKPSGIAHAVGVWPLSLELSAAPGETATGSIRLTNDSATQMSYTLSLRDFSANVHGDGTPVFLKPGLTGSRSMAEWLQVNDEGVVLAAGESREVHFTITVPANAAPGGYTTALLFGSTNVEGSVSVRTEVGSLIFLNVTGEAKTAGALNFFSAPYLVSHLPETFTTSLENTGATTFAPTGSIVITDLFGQKRADLPFNTADGHVLQSSKRTFETTWQRTEVTATTPEIVREWKNFGLGLYRATLVVNIGLSDQTLTSETHFWVVPWQMLVIVAAVMILLAFLAKRARLKKRLK